MTTGDETKRTTSTTTWTQPGSLVALRHATSSFTSVETRVIEQIRVVRLYDDTLAKIADGHLEISRTFVGLPAFADAVKQAVTNPSIVEEGHTDSYVFFDHNSTNYDGYPLIVVAKRYLGTTSSHVRAVFFGENEDSGRVIYRRDGNE